MSENITLSLSSLKREEQIFSHHHGTVSITTFTERVKQCAIIGYSQEKINYTRCNLGLAKKYFLCFNIHSNYKIIAEVNRLAIAWTTRVTPLLMMVFANVVVGEPGNTDTSPQTSVVGPFSGNIRKKTGERTNRWSPPVFLFKKLSNERK
jgi:hypothetical protein